ncbi:hypothetical protein HUG17_2889 [Dermatophagoides farinae]|uniref:Uncharacterized protein n=1 Tax=Dermatophagoides farinae TaxID=6954 RepID=A0A9D4SEL4_DERFA|nr:hypothetical protein HUG17_2889 [Dermatophagoides farinae]
MQLPKKILDAIMKRFGWLNEMFYNMANNSKQSVEMIENNERISRLKLWIRSNDPLAKFDVQTNHVYHTISAASTAPTAAKITDNFSSLPAVQILNDDGNRQQQQQQRSSESTTFGKNSEIFTTTTSVNNMIATKTNSKLNESLPIMVAACNEKRKQHRATIDLKCSKFIIFTMIMLFLLLFTFILFISYRLIYNF